MCFTLVVCAACGGGVEAARTPAHSSLTELGPPSELRAPYDAEIPIAFLSLGGPLAPVVSVMTPSGLPLEFLLDSGADAHLLWDPAFTLIGGVDGDAAVSWVNAAAERVELARIASPALSLGRTALEPTVHVPMPFDTRVAGIFSPVLWARDETLQIDLRMGVLRRGEALRELAANGEGAFVTCEGGAVPHATVEVVLDGVPLRLTLDTASSHTFVTRGAIQGTALSERPEVSSERATTDTGESRVSLLGEVNVTVGATTLTTAVAVTEREDDCEAGQLGLDALGHCVIELSPASVRLACDATPPDRASFAPRPDRIAIEAVDLEPACGMDADGLQALTHPVAPWLFATWGDVFTDATRNWLEVEPGEMADGLSQMTGACRREQGTEPEWALSFRRGERGLVLVARIARQRPI